MAIKKPQLSEFVDPETITPQDMAAMRWQAVEGFNSAPKLSPMARRLGIALVCAMDAKTRQCFPSELRLSTKLGVHLVSIKKAKVELQAALLITWLKHGGPRHLSHYSFNWTALLRYSQSANKIANEVVLKSKTDRQRTSISKPFSESCGSQETTIEKRRDSSQETTISSENSNTVVAVSLPNSSHSGVQGSHFATPIVAVGLPDITQDITQLDITQLNTPFRENDGLVFEDELNDLIEVNSTPSEIIEKKEAHEKGSGPLPPRTIQPVCFWITLTKALDSEPQILQTLLHMNQSNQEHADKLRATKGIEAAKAFISKFASERVAA
jgi:hypothetical protein